MQQRNLADSILAALKDTPVVFLAGARQVGKSTLCQWLAENGHTARYLTLDDAAVLAAARADPGGFLASLAGPVILDEAQRVLDLSLAIKAAVDRSRKPGRFLLTGSANVLLLPRLAEALAGRMEVLILWPFSQGELRGTKESFADAVFADPWNIEGRFDEARGALLKKVAVGGYPPACERKDPERRKAWFGSYLTTILQRDIRDLANVEGLVALPRLLALVASRAGGLLNHADLSRGAGIPQTTLKRYMALLETTFLVRTVPAWSSNLGLRLTKSPKLFLCDTGLLAYLLGWQPEETRGAGNMMGAALENFVVMELTKQITWSKGRPGLFHFRTQTGQEVDIVLENARGEIVGIEVKASSLVDSKDFKGLRVLAAATGERFRRGVVLYTGNEVLPFGPNLYAAPAAALWSRPKGV